MLLLTFLMIVLMDNICEQIYNTAPMLNRSLKFTNVQVVSYEASGCRSFHGNKVVGSLLINTI